MLKRAIIILGSAVALCTAMVGLIYFVSPLRHDVRTAITTTAAHLSAPADAPFPGINTAALTSTQARIVSLARAQYAKHPVSYDQNVLVYSQNTKEAWCSDFISWIMLQAGTLYRNPNSGSWRIPGVFTLQEYYQAQGRYVAAGSYQPHTGDAAIFIGHDDLGQLSSHVAFMLNASNGQMTTIGGNEGGKLRIDTQSTRAGINRLAGFGKLSNS